MNKDNLYTSISFGIVTVMFGGLIWAMAFSDMPDVHISYSTKECVAVINYGDTEYTCDNYPKKYNHIWVQ